MLTIRRAQIAVLAGPGLARFRGRASDHLRAQFPRPCAPLSDADLLAAVDHALARCADHRIELESDILRFLNLMFLFGARFDEDPAIDWAAPILARTELDPHQRMDALYAAALAREAEGRGYAGED